MKATGEEADRAWELCEESFQYHPELIRGEYALYRAIRAIALRAWSAREAELRKQGIYAAVPNFIIQARERAGIRTTNGARYPPNMQQIPQYGMVSTPGVPSYGTPQQANAMLDPALGQASPQMGYALHKFTSTLPSVGGDVLHPMGVLGLRLTARAWGTDDPIAAVDCWPVAGTVDEHHHG